MGVKINPEYLEDKVRFNYEIKQCPGVPDEGGTFGERVVEIPYYHVNKLPLLPKEIDHIVMGDVHIEEFYIPKTDETIAFAIGSWKETGAGERMFELSGPYYKPK